MATEVFNRIGESEIYDRPERPSFYKKEEESDNNPNEKIESSKPLSKAKKEFREYLEEKDSLTLDTCDKLTREWKK